MKSISGLKKIMNNKKYALCGTSPLIIILLISISAHASQGITYTYDALGRIETITKPMGYTIQYDYQDDLNRVMITDERYSITYHNYESFGHPDDKRLSSVENPGEGTTSYTYTAKGDLSTVTLTGGIVHSYGYNTKQFLIYETLPEMDVISGDSDNACIRYDHDNVGNVRYRTDARGQTTYTYDDINRLMYIDYDDDTPDVTYTYYGNDLVHTMSSVTAAYTYTYYDDNKLQQKSYTIDGHAYSVGFGYNGLRNLSSITYPSGRVVTYNYYPDNKRINSVNDSVLNRYLAWGIEYHPSGQASRFTYGNGKTTNIEYDDLSRLETINSGSILSLQYEYDGCDNITSITNNGSTTCMNCDGYSGYDILNRLIHANGPWGRAQYDYDYNGNRTSQTLGASSITYSINATTNRLDSYSGQVSHGFSYDGAGNLATHTVNSAPQYTFVYDRENRITSATVGSLNNTYSYDGTGNRIKKVTDSDTTIYHYGLDNSVISETTTSGAPVVDYMYLGSKIIAKYTW